MRNDLPTATPQKTQAHPAPSSDDAEFDALEQDYRAAEWSYNPAAYSLLEETAAYYPAADPASDLKANGNGIHLRESDTAEPAAADWTGVQNPAAKMSPRPNLRMAGRRPDDGPQDTESKILAVSAQLQDLLEQRKEEAGSGLLSAAAQGKRTGFKPAGASQTGSRLPVAPPISLPVRAHRPPREVGWPGLGRARMQWKRPVFFTALSAGVIFGSFWLGRASRAPAAVAKGATTVIAQPPAGSSAWTDANIKVLDQALAADRAGDLEGAARSLAPLMATSKSAYGLMAYRSNLESRRGFTVEAEGTLSGTSDLATPPGIVQMSFVFTRDRNFDKASDWLEHAIISDPFPAENFYRLGESLRRKGNYAESVTRFDEALVRMPTEPEFNEQREIISFKMRLAEIEGGRRLDVLPELEAQLKLPAPSGWWALTAAAAALQDRDMPTAATWLAKAKGALGEDRFNALINDYFFRAFADHSEITPFFAASEATRKRKQISPMAFFVDP